MNNAARDALMTDHAKQGILIASAENSAILRIAGALESAGFSVFSVSGAREARKTITPGISVRLILADSSLLMNPEFRMALAASPELSEIPVLVAFSGDEPLSVPPGMETAIYGYLDRNSCTDVLLRSVETALRLHASIASARGRNQSRSVNNHVPAPGEPIENLSISGANFDHCRTLLDSTDDIVFVKDENSRYLMINRSCRDFFGKSEREIIGRTDHDLSDPEAAGYCLLTDRKALRQNRLVVSSEVIEGRIYESRKFPVLLDGGKTGVGAFIRDITETRRAEERLLVSEKKLYLRNRIAQLFLTVPGDEIYDGILEVVREMLDSRLGVFRHVDSEQSFVSAAAAGIEDGPSGVGNADSDSPLSLLSGACGLCLAEGRSFYRNCDPSQPDGHPGISCTISSPIMYGDRPIGVVTLANRPGGYDDRDLEDLEEMSLYIAPLLFARMEYARKENERRAAESRLVGYSSDMAFLSRTAMGFIDLPAGLDIFEYIAQSLEELLPGLKILVNEFDPVDGTTVIRAVAGIKGLGDTVMKLLGRSPVGLRTPMPVEHRKELLSQKLRIAPGSFYELSGRKLPELVCRAIDRLLDIGTIYGMGFSRQDVLYGNVLLVAPKGTDLKDASIIEAFINQASVALQRHRAEAELASSLKEKEFLFRELQHRVKNSLAMISSLVNLELARTPSEGLRAPLSGIRDRIATISRLYSLLHHSRGADQIRLDSYIEQIVRSLLRAHIEEGRRMELHFSMVEAGIDFKRAASLGIIVNELVTNSIKYALGGPSDGRLIVSLERTESSLSLRVVDDGPGPPEGFDISSSPGLGLDLVRMLAKQLRGEVEFVRNGDTSFSVRIPFP